MTSNIILSTDVNVQSEAWKTIIINNKPYSVQVTKGCNFIKVLLTDLVKIWSESLTKELILDKCKRLNPVLTVDNDEYELIVEKTLSNISDHAVVASVSQIQLRMNYEGGIFKFSLDLCEGTPQEFWEYVIKPLCISSMELLHRQNFLVDLIKKKDIEITEYKVQGAELLRKHIETKLFNEDQFEAHMFEMDNMEYTTTFHKMMEIYVGMNIQRRSKEENKFPSTSSDTSITLKKQITAEQRPDKSESTYTVEISKNVTTKTESDNEHDSSKITSEPIIKQAKYKMKKKKSKNTKMTITPITILHKRNKKTLNNFIL